MVVNCYQLLSIYPITEFSTNMSISPLVKKEKEKKTSWDWDMNKRKIKSNQFRKNAYITTSIIITVIRCF